MRKVRAASQRSWKRVGFNEASSGWMRKELEALRADGGGAKGFNEASSGWMRKGRYAGLDPSVTWGFNEASSGWMRKGEILHEFEYPNAVASMRPHPDG